MEHSEWSSAQTDTNSWVELFDGARLCTCSAAPTQDSECHVDVIEAASPQPEYVRSEQGPYHGILLFTGTVDQGEDRLQGGPLHFTGAAPGDLHVYSRSRNEEPHLSRWHQPLSLVSVRISPSAVARACRAASLGYDDTTFISRFDTDDPFLQELVRQFARTLMDAAEEPVAPSQQMYVDQLVQAAAAHLVQHYTAQQPTISNGPSGLPPARLRRVKAYVEAHLDEAIALKDLAAVACYSEYHFCRAFKRSTGYSPYHYVIHRRMQEAARLLREHPHRRIGAVARAVGYTSPSHFSRQFKKYHGAAPSRWKQNIR